MWGDGSVPMLPLFLLRITHVHSVFSPKQVLGRYLVGTWSVLGRFVTSHLNISVTLSAHILYSGSGNLSLRHSDIISPMPRPQLSRTFRLYNTFANNGFCGFDSCSDFIFSASQLGGKVPGFSISTRSSYMAMPTEPPPSLYERWVRLFNTPSLIALYGMVKCSSRSNVSVVPDKERCLKIKAIAALSS